MVSLQRARQSEYHNYEDISTEGFSKFSMLLLDKTAEDLRGC